MASCSTSLSAKLGRWHHTQEPPQQPPRFLPEQPVSCRCRMLGRGCRGPSFSSCFSFQACGADLVGLELNIMFIRMRVRGWSRPIFAAWTFSIGFPLLFSGSVRLETAKQFQDFISTSDFCEIFATRCNASNVFKNSCLAPSSKLSLAFFEIW